VFPLKWKHKLTQQHILGAG